MPAQALGYVCSVCRPSESEMNRVSTVEFIRNFGLHSDSALSAPIVITKSDRDRLVLMSIEQYDRPKNICDAFQTTATKTPRGRPKPVHETGQGVGRTRLR